MAKVADIWSMDYFKHLCHWEVYPRMSSWTPKLHPWCPLHESEACQPTRGRQLGWLESLISPGIGTAYKFLWVQQIPEACDFFLYHYMCSFLPVSLGAFILSTGIQLKETACNHYHLLYFLYWSESVLHLHENDNKSSLPSVNQTGDCLK